MKLLATISLLIAAVIANDTEITPKKGPIEWEKHEYDVDEYFKDIPDLVNMTNIQFKFSLIHSFILGFERGIYNDSSILLNEDCFGDYYVNKLNQYEYLFVEDPFENIWTNLFPEISLTYQFLYMMTN